MNTLTYHKGWELRWNGWQQPDSQDRPLGAWIAYPPTAGTARLVMTTTGALSQVTGLERWDTRQHPDWPVLDSRTTDTEKDAVKRLALDMLKRKLDA